MRAPSRTTTWAGFAGLVLVFAGLGALGCAPAAPVAERGNAATPAATPGTPGARAAKVAGEIIIDNDDPGFTKKGDWAGAEGGHDYNGGTVWVTGTTATEKASTATWTPEIKVAGQYDVYEWHGDDPNSDHASNAPFTVKFDGGEKTVAVDLRAKAGRWNLLGTFKFAAGKGGSVTVSSQADGNVVADAVRLVPRP